MRAARRASRGRSPISTARCPSHAQPGRVRWPCSGFGGAPAFRFRGRRLKRHARSTTDRQDPRNGPGGHRRGACVRARRLARRRTGSRRRTLGRVQPVDRPGRAADWSRPVRRRRCRDASGGKLRRDLASRRLRERAARTGDPGGRRSRRSLGRAAGKSRAGRACEFCMSQPKWHRSAGILATFGVGSAATRATGTQ